MTDTELQELFANSMKRSREIERKYRATGELTRREANDLRHCTQRIGIVARELWLRLGKPNDPEFDCLREPIKLSPLPASMRPLDLSHKITGGVN